MKERILHSNNLSIGYHAGCELYDQLDLSAEVGQLVALIGANGKGKSTLLKTLGGSLTPLNGTVYLAQKELSNWAPNELARQMAVVLTDPLPNGYFTVESFIAFGRYPFTNWMGRLSEHDRKVVKDAMDTCQINKLSGRYIGELSDGERQKVAIARAIAQEPRLILMDEPTTHLDLKTRAEIMILLKQLCQDQQKTIILSTHQLDLALQVADRIWWMEDRKIINTDAETLAGMQNFQEKMGGEFLAFDPNHKTFRLK